MCCCWNILPIITFLRSRTWWRWCVTVLTHLEVSVGPWTLSPQLIMEDLERLEEDLELLQALSFCLWTSKEHEDHFRLTNVQKFLMKSFRYSSDFEVKEKLLFCCCLWIFPQFTESGCLSPGERLTLTLTSHPQPVCLHTQTNVPTVWARGPTGWPQRSGGGALLDQQSPPCPPTQSKTS